MPVLPQPLTVLLAEDDDLCAAAWSTVLGLKGCDVVHAPNGAIALALARDRCPVILVTDWMMPEVDGLSLCLAFRVDPTLRCVPIVFMSSLPPDHGG